MRVEPRGVGSIAHVIKRGTRGLPIVRDASDKDRFAYSLFHLNDTFSDSNWPLTIKRIPPFTRPEHWPEREPLTEILAWTLLPNHFHLLLREICDGGIAKFMQRLCGSMSASFNAKYGETGSIFQSSYKSKTVDEDTYLRYLAFYIQLKNVLELRPGGLRQAAEEFDAAWEWATAYPYSSFMPYIQHAESPIIGSSLLHDMFPDRKAFKEEGREMILTHLDHHSQEYRPFDLEQW